MSGVPENLQQQMEQQTAAISKLSEQVKRLEHTLTKLDSKSSHCNENPARESGYVNWDDSHDSIKNMKWSKCHSLRNRCLYFPHSRETLHCKIINEDTRFPEDEKEELYINLKDPTVQYVIQHHICLSENDRREYNFITLLKDHMHTRSSFEEKYKLRWVDPNPMKQNSEKKQPISSKVGNNK